MKKENVLFLYDKTIEKGMDPGFLEGGFIFAHFLTLLLQMKMK